MTFEKILTKITSDGHLPIGFVMFIVGSVLHWLHGLSADYVAFTTTILGFLGAHAWTQSKSEANADPKGGTNADGSR